MFVRSYIFPLTGASVASSIESAGAGGACTCESSERRRTCSETPVVDGKSSDETGADSSTSSAKSEIDAGLWDGCSARLPALPLEDLGSTLMGISTVGSDMMCGGWRGSMGCFIAITNLTSSELMTT